MSLGGGAASWKQPPHLAAHWPQSHHWDFQNADEMAFAKILRTTIKMYKWRVMFPYREVWVVFPCSPLTAIPREFPVISFLTI